MLHPVGQPEVEFVGIDEAIDGSANRVPELATSYSQFVVLFVASHVIVGAYAVVRFEHLLNIYAIPSVPTLVMLRKSGEVVSEVQLLNIDSNAPYGTLVEAIDGAVVSEVQP